MGVREIVDVVSEIFEFLKDTAYGVEENDDSIIIDIQDYLITKKFKKGRVEYKLIDGKSGEVLGYIETDGRVYYNMIGNSNWEDFIEYLGW